MTSHVDTSGGGGAPDVSTVFIVDDDPLVRAAVRLAATTLGCRVEEYVTPALFLAAADARRSGCVVLEAHLPGMSGLDLQTALSARGVTWPVLFVTANGNVHAAVQALRAGALDFLQKPIDSAGLLECLREAIALDRTRRHAAAHEAERSQRLGRLTRREREVLALLVAGHGSRAIAATLTLSPKTVETHRANLMQKTGAASLADLLRMGLELEYRTTLAGAASSAYGSPAPVRWRR